MRITDGTGCLGRLGLASWTGVTRGGAAVVTVRLVGGPPDGEQWDETEEEVAGGGGAYLIVAGPQAAGMRAHYAPVPGGDPAVWEWRGWVPD